MLADLTAVGARVTVNPLDPIAESLPRAIREALGTHPTTCHASDRDLRLTVTPLDAKRVIVLGERVVPDFAPIQGRDAAGAPLGEWRVSIAREYDRRWMTGDAARAAATILDDFAPAVFEREVFEHHTTRGF